MKLLSKNHSKVLFGCALSLGCSMLSTSVSADNGSFWENGGVYFPHYANPTGLVGDYNINTGKDLCGNAHSDDVPDFIMSESSISSSCYRTFKIPKGLSEEYRIAGRIYVSGISLIMTNYINDYILERIKNNQEERTDIVRPHVDNPLTSLATAEYMIRFPDELGDYIRFNSDDFSEKCPLPDEPQATLATYGTGTIEMAWNDEQEKIETIGVNGVVSMELATQLMSELGIKDILDFQTTYGLTVSVSIGANYTNSSANTHGTSFETKVETKDRIEVKVQEVCTADISIYAHSQNSASNDFSVNIFTTK